MSPSVVVTGLGAITPLGDGPGPLLRGLTRGECALRSRLHPDLPRLGPLTLGEVGAALPRVTSSRALDMLLYAGRQAWAHSGLEPTSGEQTPVVVGTAQGGLDVGGRLGLGELQPTDEPSWRLYHPHAGARALAAALGLTGPTTTVGMACVSSAMAALQGLRLIQRGEARRVLVAGFDALSPMVIEGFHALGAVATSVCRPFDRGRDGLALGEGAAALVLEEERSALERGAVILARVQGGARRCDALNLAAPDPEGRALALAILAALEDASLPPGRLAYLKAHGTGTLPNDAMEVAAWRRVFGGRIPPATSPKGSFGHTLGAAGAVELAATTLCLGAGEIPPITGLTAPMSEGLDLVAAPGRRAAGPVLCTWSAFGGHHVALVLSPPAGEPG